MDASPPPGRDPAFLLFGTDRGAYRWIGVRLFAAAYFGAFLAAALLAPPLYQLVHVLAAGAEPGSALDYLAGQPFYRYVDRLRMLAAAVLVLWLVRRCGLWGRFGFGWRNRGLAVLAVYFGLGVLSLGIVVAGQALLAGGVQLPEAHAARVARVLAAALAGGLLLGWLEEAIFRGMVLRLFYTATRPQAALLLSALVFAAAHFKSVPPDLAAAAAGWGTAFRVAAWQAVAVVYTVEWLMLANYLLVGLVLGLLFLRTRSLIPCMGLHAGWVLVRNSWGELAVVPEGPATLFWGSGRLVDGLAALILLGAIAIALYVEWSRHPRRAAAGMAGRP